MRKILVTLIISCLFQATISQKNNIIEKTKVQAKIIDAKQSFLENNIKNSQLIYKEILALDPENTKAHYGLAKCYYKLHNYEKAKFHAENTYNTDPEIDDEIDIKVFKTNKNKDGSETIVTEEQPADKTTKPKETKVAAKKTAAAKPAEERRGGSPTLLGRSW